MNHIWNETLDAVLGVGKSLEPIGIRNFAMNKESALAAVAQLEFLGIAVLGGDVYVDQSGCLEVTCDNWYCQPLEKESSVDYVHRSIIRAREYIQGYQLEGAYFALVPRI